MACEFLYNPVQTVALNAPILFDTSIPCSKGNVYHEGQTGNFILRGARSNNGGCGCNQFAQYQVTFNGNIAVPTGGTVPAGGAQISRPDGQSVSGAGSDDLRRPRGDHTEYDASPGG